MLLDVLGTLTAFISVVLLLSILVTTTVQLIQSVLRLRARNLMKGLAQLIMKAKGDPAPSGFGWLKGDAAAAKREAAELLNDSSVALINQVKNPQNWLHYWILGPKVSWVEPDEIVAPVQKISGIDASKAKQLAADLERAGEKLKDRFQLTIRAITFAVGLLIAFSFQVSAPQLFSDLSEQTEIQQKIAVDADQLLERIGKQLEPGGDQRAQQPAETTAELRNEIDSIVGALSQYKIEFWHDEDFYVNRANTNDADTTNDEDTLKFEALLGVFLTAILLSLGAPFWYEQLRKVIRFRDLMSGSAGMSASGAAVAEQPDDNAKKKGKKGKKGKKKSNK